MRKIIVLLVAAVLGVLATSALARPPAFDTKITIKSPPDKPYKFHGRVRSEQNKVKCYSHRPLQMFRKLDGPDEKVADFESESDGTWSFEFVGTYPYYVVAKREHFTRDGHNFICKRGQSPAI